MLNDDDCRPAFSIEREQPDRPDYDENQNYNGAGFDFFNEKPFDEEWDEKD